MADLLSCPFCGVRGYPIPRGTCWMIECGGCGVEMYGLDEEDAAKQWNTRAQGIEARQGGDAYRAEANALSPRGRGSIVRREPGPKDAPKAHLTDEYLEFMQRKIDAEKPKNFKLTPKASREGNTNE